MYSPTAVLVTISTFAYVSAASSSVAVRENCIIKEFSQVAAVSANCDDIVVSNLKVPPGETLDFEFSKPGVTITFEGKTTFGFKEWGGPLLSIQANSITVQGAPGSVLDGNGPLYWDGKGAKGRTKPKFFRIKATGGSVFRDINLLNCPVHCTTISKSDSITLSGWNIDVSEGDKDNLGHNTDGFDIGGSNIVIENSTVKNQDDCVAINRGWNMLLKNLECIGGHGLSLSVGISEYGVHIQQDYKDGRPTGKPTSNIPIKGLTLSRVTGTLEGPRSTPVEILCGDKRCENFDWTDVSFTGAANPSSCNFSPNGYNC
ncbi:hypothetical protein JTB14_015203 [Gonioctena quinquepunctata]|nr:hypothetical protein JTB14_015203 [Gonioctena quinquepunctata]